MKYQFNQNDYSDLTVGDFVACEQWMRERRRKELVEELKELYGEKIPSDAWGKVREEVQKIRLTNMRPEDFDLQSVQFLLWRSLKKKNPTLQMEEVAESFTPAELEMALQRIFGGLIAGDSGDDNEKKTQSI